jgi:predicted kinase
MAQMDDAARLVVHADRRLAEQLRSLGEQRMVFFAGLPGTGKSLLVHQLAHLAGDAGRRIHLLQWDVARPVFEASLAGRRYPLADGVTHAVIRKAAGLWVRHALVGWNARHPEPEHLLIGETPFVGNRFVELARRVDDRAEALLAAPSCRFVVAVPSSEVRRFLEAERARRATSPLHPREREDAPPSVLRDLWRDLAEVARRLGITAPGAPDAGYDPVVYRRVYEKVLRDRNVEVVALDVILPTEKLSVYDFASAPLDLIPTDAEAEEFIREFERRYPDPTVLEREVAHWWEV